MSDDFDFLSLESSLIRAKLRSTQPGLLFRVLWEHRNNEGLSARRLAEKAGLLKTFGEPHPNSKIGLIHTHIGTLKKLLIAHNKQRRQENSNDYRFEINVSSEDNAKYGYRLVITRRQGLSVEKSEDVVETVRDTTAVGMIPRTGQKLEFASADPGTAKLPSIVSDSSVYFPLLELPPIPWYFTGRDFQIKEVCCRLRASDCNTLSIFGMPGVGKSDFARAIGYELQGNYPGGCLYYDMWGNRLDVRPRSYQQAMAYVVRTIARNLPIPADLEELSHIYFRIVNKSQLLILLDNVENKEQIAPLQVPKHCLLLVTSRRKLNIQGFIQEELRELTTPNAKLLLHKLNPAIDEHADTIVELCGNVPLALTVAAPLLNEKSLTPLPELIQQLRTKRQVLPEVDAALEVSYQQLVNDEPIRFARLGIFQSSWDAQAAASIWNLSSEDARGTLETLLNRSLLRKDPKTDRFILHDLIRKFCLEKLNDPETQETRDRHAYHFANIAYSLDTSLDNFGIEPTLYRFDTDWENIQQGHGWASKNADRLGVPLTLYGALPESILNLRMSPDDQLRWFEVLMDCNEVNECLTLRKRFRFRLSRICNFYQVAGYQAKAEELKRALRQRWPDKIEFDPRDSTLSRCIRERFNNDPDDDGLFDWIDGQMTHATKDERDRVFSFYITCSKYAKESDIRNARKCFDEFREFLENQSEKDARFIRDCFSLAGLLLLCDSLPELAIRCYKRALYTTQSQNSKDNLKLEFDSFLRILECYRNIGDVAGILETFRTALQRIPENRPDLRVELLWIKMDLMEESGQINEAIAAAESVAVILKQLNSYMSEGFEKLNLQNLRKKLM